MRYHVFSQRRVNGWMRARLRRCRPIGPNGSPARFRFSSREFERSLPRGAYVPFAGGPRVCLGKQCAMMEMRMILATLLQRIEPNLTEGFEPDFVTELAMHPGERGMQADVRFY